MGALAEPTGLLAPVLIAAQEQLVLTTLRALLTTQLNLSAEQAAELVTPEAVSQLLPLLRDVVTLVPALQALDDDPNAVANAINSLPDPESSCSASGGCTCISCGINIAWGLVPDDQKTGRDGGQPPTLLVLTDGCALRPACADLAPPSHQSPPCPDAAFKMSTEDKQQQMQLRKLHLLQQNQHLLVSLL